jgi:hypothetical protein
VVQEWCRPGPPSQTGVRVGETQSAIESTAKSVEASRTQDDFG